MLSIDLPNFKLWSKEDGGQTLQTLKLMTRKISPTLKRPYMKIAPLPDDIDHNLAKLPPLYAFARGDRKGTQSRKE